MKICILGDLHFGINHFDQYTANYQKKFFIDFLIPKLKELGISTIFQTGDFFDTRNSIKHTVMHFVRTEIMPHLNDFEIHLIPGNHDLYHRESITPNACEELLSHYQNVNIYSEPKRVEFDSASVDFIPWICQSNKDEIFKFIEQSSSRFALGHFELAGYLYYPGIKSDGDNPHFLNHYETVISGHYHTISEGKNVIYVGTPYQLTYGDANDIRGFHVLDTETETLEFYQNPVQTHYKINYDENNLVDDFSQFENKCVSINVKKYSDSKKYFKFLEDLALITHDLSCDDFKHSELLNSIGQLEIEDNNVIEVIKLVIEELEEMSEVKENILFIMLNLYKELLEHDQV